MNINDIQKAVRHFRRAMEQCHEQFGLPFESFPRGCCGDSSELLAAYLKDEGFGEFAYVFGWSGEEDSSHAWLEKDGIIIDVTTDQFSGRENSPMITDDQEWHSRFSDCLQRRRDGDFRLVNGSEHLLSTFVQLKKFINGER